MKTNIPLLHLEPNPPGDHNVPRGNDIIPQATIPRQSTHIPVPTAKSQPDNPLVSCLKRAVRESQDAATRIQTARIKRHAAATAQINMEPGEQQDQACNQSAPADLPDLTNLATVDEIEHLLVLAKSQANPISLDLGDEPSTWQEAQKLPDAPRWRAAYKEELKSLRDMEVYKLIPRDQVPTGHKIWKGRPVFKIEWDKTGKIVRYKV